MKDVQLNEDEVKTIIEALHEFYDEHRLSDLALDDAGVAHQVDWSGKDLTDTWDIRQSKIVNELFDKLY